MMGWLAQNGPALTTVCFFLGFCGIALWAYWPGNKARMSEDGRIPFKEQDNG